MEGCLATISFIFGLLMVICVFMALKEKEFAAAVFAVLFAAIGATAFAISLICKTGMTYDSMTFGACNFEFA